MARTDVKITLYKSEIIYDVQNKTYITGRSRQTGDNHEQVANMQANNDEENLNQILRSIGTAYDYMKAKMAEFMTGKDEDGNDILLNISGNITVSLSLPENYNKATVDSIASALHNIIVNKAIADWFTLTNKADAADYAAAAASEVNILREALNKRTRPVRNTSNLS
jgi:hypothetical protein